MKPYHVHAIGNALVDMEFEISEEILASLEIDKGLMTLIDEQRHHDLYDTLRNLPHKRACGGSAANTVIAAAQLGASGFYCCKVASDATGDFFLEDMQATGVDNNLQQQSREIGTTGKCIVMVTPDAERSMNTFLGITADLGPQQLQPDAIQSSEYYYMEGYLVASPTGRAAAVEGRKIAEQAGVRTALTLSDPNMVQFFKDGLLEMAGEKLDMLFCNREEALLMTESSDLTEALEGLKKLSKAVAITDGSRGSLLFDGEQTQSVSPVRSVAVDSNGAGDMYAGSFLYGITHGMSMQQSAHLASATAARVVAHFGPRLPGELTREILAAQKVQ